MQHALHVVFALREGPWKFVPSRGRGGFNNPQQMKPTTGESSAQLDNPSTDTHETRNLATIERATATRLAQRLAETQSGPLTRPP